MKAPMSDKKLAKLTLTACGALIMAGILFSHPGPALVAVGVISSLGLVWLIGFLTDASPARRSPEALAFEAEWHAAQARLDAELEANVAGWKAARAKVHAELEAEREAIKTERVRLDAMGEAIRNYPDPNRTVH